MNNIGNSSPEDDDRDPSEKALNRSWLYVVTLLAIAYALNIADRQVIYILLEPMKKDIGLRDWEVGAVGGLSFALVYATMALPIARLADYVNRSRLIAGAIAIWSTGTIISSSVSSFTQLAAARVVVGLGESGFTPTAHSLISETVPKERRTLGFGILSIGQAMGGMLALAFGGVIADLWGWRAAFLFAGLPGIVVGLLILLTIRDPRQAHKNVVEKKPINFIGDMVELFKSKSFMLFVAGGGLYGITAYGISAFFFSFISRNHGDQLSALSTIVSNYLGVHLYGPGLLGPILGANALVCGVSSALISGWLTDRLVKRNVRYFSLISAIPLIIALFIYVILLTTSNFVLALICYAIGYFLMAFVSAPLTACIQHLARPSNRATASAISLLTLVGMGNGLGPLFVGILSDVAGYWDLDAGASLRFAMIVIVVVPTSLASLMLLLAGRYLPRELGARI